VDEHRTNRLAPFVVTALVLAAAAHLWWFVASLQRASFASRLSHSLGSFVLADATARDHEVRLAATAVILTDVVAAVVFITWLYRLVSDIDRRRPGTLHHGTGWAIGGWFVPIWSWFRPKQVVDDAWRSASPANAWTTRSPWWVNGWWAAWVIAQLTFVVSRFQDPSGLAGLATRDRTTAVGCAIDAVAAVFAVMTVVSLSNRAGRVPAAPVLSTGQHGMRFNPAPGWPLPPEGWAPPMGWQPDPSWPSAPPGWRFWIP
jgi:hypothetical protein